MRKRMTLVLLLLLSIMYGEAFSQQTELFAMQTSNTSSSFLPDSQSSPMEMKKRRKKKSKRRGKRGSKDAFAQGAKVATVYFGWPNVMGSFLKEYEINDGFESSSLGPLGAKFEYGLTDKFGLGLTINVLNTSLSYTDQGIDGNNYTYTLTYNSLSVNLRANWHYYTTDNLDVYFGLGPGYPYKKFIWESDDPNFTDMGLNFALLPFSFEMTQGVRYYFTPNIGAFAEVGLSKGYLQGGIVAKF